MSKLSSPLKVTNFNEKDAITLAETVTAYNQGRKAVFMGTPVALKRNEFISTLCVYSDVYVFDVKC